MLMLLRSSARPASAPARAHRPSSPIPDPGRSASFEETIAAWFPLTFVLNNLNRGLGLPDGYPFVLSDPVIEKLRLVHETIALPGTTNEELN